MSTFTLLIRKKSSPFLLGPCYSDAETADNLSDSGEPKQHDNVAEALGTIRDYLRGIGEGDLKLQIQENLIYTPEIKAILRGYRALYDPEKGVLTVRGMARPLHDAVFRLASNFLVNIINVGLLASVDNIQLTPECQMLSGAIEGTKKKIQAWHKFPDACFIYENPDTLETIPTVIFEVGFTESYVDLISDMRQWLIKSKDVLLVVLVDVKENHTVHKARRNTPECEQRINKLLKEFGNSKGKAILDQDEEYDENDTASDDELYKTIRQAVETDDWVGPIEAYIELWERGVQGPQKRGRKLVSCLVPKVI